VLPEATSLNGWSVSQVCDWLQSIGCVKETVRVFREENISGCAVPELNVETLKEMKIKVGDRSKIIQGRDALVQEFAAQKESQEQLSPGSASGETTDKEVLEKKLLHLLCGGEEVFRGDRYLILVLSTPTPSMTTDWMEENLSFLCSLEWKAVFDFDQSGTICEFFQRHCEVKITMTDEFDTDSGKYSSDHRQLITDDIKNSVQPSWIFANGYGTDEALPPMQWKRKRSDSFKHAVQFFGSEIPPGRATVVFLMFTKATDIIFLEAADEFFLRFQDNWLCIADSTDIGSSWTKELERRQLVESPEEKTIAGLSWAEVNRTVTTIKPVRKQKVCMIPSSTGSPVVLDSSTVSELTEFEVLGCNECQDEDKQLDGLQKENLMKTEEIRFYRGGSPSWWNFYFKDQVCPRETHSNLYSLVTKTLASTSTDAVVDRVRILHQPGAGGTTLAKHVLWDMRKEYRVAAVHNCVDHRSSTQRSRLARQILKLYQHEEMSEDAKPRPVLLLLDNPDEETEYCLIGELVEMAKRIKTYGEQNQLVCVFLVCLRTTQSKQTVRVHESKKGRKSDPSQVCLLHSLSEREREWFQRKDKALQEDFDRYPDGVNPKLLISFNILKENFDKHFIQRMVREFVENISKEKEKKLLKYISLINAYDLECRPLPLAAFDNMMGEVKWVSCGKKKTTKKQAYMELWENSLSDEFHILMNESSERGMGYIQSLRITNPLLAKEILNCLREMNGNAQTVSDIALEFFHCKEVFEVSCYNRERLLCVVKDVLNKRQRRADRRPEQKFSPIVLDIRANEKDDIEVDRGDKNACQVLDEGYKLTEDAFVAQTLARLFIELRQWNQAFTFAEIATKMIPKNSYLWDTYGCIYEKQLQAAPDSYTSDVNWLANVVQLAMKGIDIFRSVQKLSEQEKLPNAAGYYGELRIIVNVLECLKCFDEFRNIECLRQFLIDDAYVLQHVEQLTDMDGENYVEVIKSLKKNVVSVLHYLEDDKLQLRTDTFRRYEHDNLDDLKDKLDRYFGEDTDEPPEGLSERKQCYFRQRRIFKLASNNMRGIFELRWDKDGPNQLVAIRRIVAKNIRSPAVGALDYMTAITVDLAMRSMISVNQPVPPDFASICQEINFEDILQWSLKLYHARHEIHATYLEPYLFLTMFNWPRENTKPLVAPHAIETALQEWRDAYIEKYPRQRDEEKPYRKKDVTMFFLANGNGIQSIYTWYKEHENPRTNDAPIWKLADDTKNLQRFKGTVVGGGRKVEYCFEGSTFDIATSFPLDRMMWRKKVVYVIGFSWNGPKAFDVRLDTTS